MKKDNSGNILTKTSELVHELVRKKQIVRCNRRSEPFDFDKKDKACEMYVQGLSNSLSTSVIYSS